MAWVVAFGLLGAFALKKRVRKVALDDDLYKVKTLNDRLWANVFIDGGGRRPQKLKF